MHLLYVVPLKSGTDFWGFLIYEYIHPLQIFLWTISTREILYSENSACSAAGWKIFEMFNHGWVRAANDFTNTEWSQKMFCFSSSSLCPSPPPKKKEWGSVIACGRLLWFDVFYLQLRTVLPAAEDCSTCSWGLFYLQLRTRMLRTFPRIPSPAVPVEHTPRIQNLKTKKLRRDLRTYIIQ
jgi:hypothetical protein